MKPSLSISHLAWVAMFGAAILFTSGCHQADEARDYGDPTRLDALTVQGGIWMQFIAPSDPIVTGKPDVEVSLNAWTDDVHLPLEVSGSAGQTARVLADVDGEPGPNQLFTLPVQLLHGPNVVTAAISQPEEGLRRLATYVLDYQGHSPGLQLHGVSPAGNGGCPAAPRTTGALVTNASHVCLYGSLSAASGREVTSLSVEREDGVVTEAMPGEAFVIQSPLEEDSPNVLRVVAQDSAGSTTAYTLTVKHSSTLPTLVIDVPSEAYVRTSDAVLVIEGSGSSAIGLNELLVYNDETLIGRFPAEGVFPFELQLGVGLNAIRVVLTDLAGNEAEARFDVFRDRVSTLHASDGRGSETLLQLDKAALSALLDVDAQKEIILAGVGLRPFLYSAIAAIRDPYAFGNDPNDFGPAEFNFHRLLNLSADSADLGGTSLGELSDLAYAIGLPTARVLAELLDVEVDEPALTTDLIVEVLLENLIMSHPEVVVDDAGDPVLEIRLYDALNDLQPLAERFGPVPDTGHPGIIGGSIFAEVLESGFLLSAKAISHLIAYEGIDAARGSKDYIYILEGDEVLSLDVYDEDTFSVVGIVDEPMVDVTFSLNEHPAFVAAGTQRNVNPDPDRPGAFKGDNIGWTLEPWILERIVLDIVYRRFVDAYPSSDYQSTLTYDAGSIIDATKFVWSRGWFTTTTAGGLGDPPAPQYVWDALSELAQVRLHDGGLAEGEANARFDLQNVPVGVDADGLVAAIRPELDAQQDRLSQLLLGDGGIAVSTADFYYVETLSSGAALLHFRHPNDNEDSPSFPRPGFFADEGLSDRIDTTQAIGSKPNSTHRKVAVQKGDVVYYADEDDDVYRVEIVAVRATQLDLMVTAGGTP